MAELKICGLAAVRARFQRDAGSIKRLFFDYATGRQIGVMTKALAAARKVYRCVEPPELEKVAGTIHHGGIVAIVEAPILKVPGPEELRSWAKRREPVLVLDRIGNAHNLGAIARTAGFFGVPHLIVADDATAAKPNDAAYRIAEGGFEHVRVWIAPNLPALLHELAKAGYAVIGAAAAGGKAAPRDRNAPPAALVLGNEEHGLSREVTAACTALVTISGSGRVESLNVSAAAAILIRELLARP